MTGKKERKTERRKFKLFNNEIIHLKSELIVKKWRHFYLHFMNFVVSAVQFNFSCLVKSGSIHLLLCCFEFPGWHGIFMWNMMSPSGGLEIKCLDHNLMMFNTVQDNLFFITIHFCPKICKTQQNSTENLKKYYRKWSRLSKTTRKYGPWTEKNEEINTFCAIIFVV